MIPRKQRIDKGSDRPECPVRTPCTKARYRTIAREKREPLQEEMRKRLFSEEGRKKYKKRLYTVEPIFGHFKSFPLRSLEKLRGELKLMCIGYNLRKILLHQRARAVA